MSHLDLRAGVTVLLALALATACTTTPGAAKDGSFQYGACPTNAVAVIRERFESGLLVAYSGEPIVWQGDKFWWQDAPQAGGRFYAGHLVVALAEQTFGRPDFQGKKLYAFIVNGDRIVKEFGPNMINRVPIKEPVGPMPFDGRTWELANKDERDTRSVYHHLPPGETLDGWTEIVTMQTDSRVPETLTVQAMLEQSEAASGCQAVEHEILASSSSELLVEQKLAKCGAGRDRYAIRKLIRGPRTATDLSYSRTTPFGDADRKKWRELVNRAVWGTPCTDPTR